MNCNAGARLNWRRWLPVDLRSDHACLGTTDGADAEATLAAVVIILFDGSDQTSRVPRHPADSSHGICLGTGCVRRSDAPGNSAGDVIAIVVSLFALSYQAANPRVYALGRKPGTNVSSFIQGTP